MSKFNDYFSSSTDCWFGPCSQGDCWDSDDPESRTPDCWVLAFCLLTVGIFLILFAEVYGDPKDCVFGPLRMYSLSKEDNTDDVDLVFSAFTETTRTEENFIRNHDDPNLQVPSDYGPEYNPTSIQASVLPLRGFRPTRDGWMLRSCSTVTVFMGSLGLSMIGSAVSTVLWLMIDYESSCLESNHLSTWAQEFASAFGSLLKDYAFYPIFLLVGYISFIANRWRDWMVNCHSLQGSIHDIGVICGGSFTKPPTLEQRKLLFKIYRHLNAIHALCYKTVSPSLSTLDLDDWCDELGLLTEDELQLLYPYPFKVRDAVIAKVTSEIAMLCDAGNVAVPHGEIIHTITRIRARTARHHDLFIRDNPNLYLNLMFWVVNTLIFFSLIAYPFTLMLRTPKGFPLLPCFQPATLTGIFLVLFSYRSAFSMISRLRNPFSWTKDRIKVDMLLASTDMCLFTVLRSAFESQPDVDVKKVDFRLSTKMAGQRRLTLASSIRTKRESARRSSIITANLHPKREHIMELSECREF